MITRETRNEEKRESDASDPKVPNIESGDINWTAVYSALISEVEAVGRLDKTVDPSEFPEKFSFEEFVTSLQSAAPHLFDLIVALILPPLRYGEEEEDDGDDGNFTKKSVWQQCDGLCSVNDGQTTL
eukprot:m.190484 g.190484  ORF g.190484 m.190484 type:complete len:127 (+) comp39433_c1_seq11:268-648(+)